MKHYIITRFNLKKKDWVSDKNNNEILSEDWLSDRFRLFFDYCLPSVKNQKNQNFKWLVYFDEDTPLKYRNIIKNIEEEYANFSPRFIAGAEIFDDSIVNDVLDDFNQYDVTTPYILTTRIDNDDALHIDFIETIQSLADNKNNLIIDLRAGVEAIVRGKYIETRKKISNYNPFISVIFNSKSYISIFSKNHVDWISCGETKVSNDIRWMQIIHTRNKHNKINWHNRLISNIDLQDFGISMNLNTLPLFYIVMINFSISVFEKITGRKPKIK